MTRERPKGVELFLDCSTSHVSSTTIDSLDEGSIYSTMRGEYGWLVFAGEADEPPEVPDDLAAVLGHARAHGCRYVLLDGDGPVLAALPTFGGDT